jgi:4-hydroxy-4-methyl-2-oxoglutarate aldolase
MEKHPYHGIIISEILRPTKNIIDGFGEHDVCKIGDAMGGHGLMDYEIKPMDQNMRVVGPAVTVLTRPGDALYVQKVIEVAQPGDVIVIDAGGVKEVSCIGERLCYYMKLKEIAGVVVDGAIRDLKGIRDINFPVYSKSVCAKIFGSIGPGAINIPIQCGGVTVNPGDIIVGDDDGVVCIPREKAEKVLKTSDEHLAGELLRLKFVEEGKSISEVFNLEKKLKKWEHSDNLC